MLCYVVLCYVVLHYLILWYVMLCPFIHSSLHLQIHSHSHFHYHTHANSHTPCQSHSFLNSSIIIVPSFINSKLLSSILTLPHLAPPFLFYPLILLSSLPPSSPPSLPHTLWTLATELNWKLKTERAKLFAKKSEAPNSGKKNYFPSLILKYF